MEGEETDDSISKLTDGTYNSEKNKKRNDELNKHNLIYHTENKIDEGKFMATEGDYRCVPRPLNAPCDPDLKRLVSGGGGEVFYKGAR